MGGIFQAYLHEKNCLFLGGNVGLFEKLYLYLFAGI